MKTSNQNQNVTTIKTHLNELDPIKTHPKKTGLRGMDFFLIYPYLSLSPFASSVVQKTELTIMGPPLVLEALEFYNIIISINFKTSRTSGDTESTDERGIYMLQTILIENNAYTIFFDTGCSDFIVKNSAIQSHVAKATILSSQVTKIGGVSQTSLQSFGTCDIKIPKNDGGTASFNGISLELITTTFPQYPLTDVHADIRKSFSSSGSD